MRLTKNAYLSLLTHTKPLLSVTFYDMITGIGSVKGQDGQKEGQKDGQTLRLK